MIRAIDIHNHLRERGDWVDWERTTDTFKAGDPDKPVRTVAVAWKPTWDALKEARSRGADLFVGHESICVNAVNGSPEPEVVFALDSERPKFEWLDRSGLAVYRCHDVWDRFPEVGIRFATITVNHGVAKEWGVSNLATYLAEAFPSLRVFHIPQQCPYVVVGGGESCHT